jgi:hypothetical protein
MSAEAIKDISFWGVLGCACFPAISKSASKLGKSTVSV